MGSNPNIQGFCQATMISGKAPLICVTGDIRRRPSWRFVLHAGVGTLKEKLGLNHLERSGFVESTNAGVQKE